MVHETEILAANRLICFDRAVVSRSFFRGTVGNLGHCAGAGSNCGRRSMDDCHLFKADKFDSCTMNRSVTDLDVTFLRTHDGLLLLLDSSKWKLDRGKAYDVTLVAGTRAVQVKALAENKSVTIPLADRSLNERMRIADVLEVRGEGATLRVPLDGSMAALGRLETCFEKNSHTGVDSNPFVAPSRKP